MMLCNHLLNGVLRSKNLFVKKISSTNIIYRQIWQLKNYFLSKNIQKVNNMQFEGDEIAHRAKIQERIWRISIPERNIKFGSTPFMAILVITIILHQYNKYKDKYKIEDKNKSE